jgi:opacity protein-like surface antigen
MKCFIKAAGQTLVLAGILVASAATLARPAVAAERAPEDRFYVASIVGASFATLTVDQLPAATDPLFTAGGAAGIDFESFEQGWRLEFEGRYRDPISQTVSIDGLDVNSTADQGWSTLVNLWRDVEIREGLEFYLGGGIGAGGYQQSITGGLPAAGVTVDGKAGVTSFAWQIGCGITCELSRRVVLDLGYRFFEVAGGATTVTTVQSGMPIGIGDAGSAFSASELLLAVRIYEPFRRWR